MLTFEKPLAEGSQLSPQHNPADPTHSESRKEAGQAETEEVAMTRLRHPTVEQHQEERGDGCGGNRIAKRSTLALWVLPAAERGRD